MNKIFNAIKLLWVAVFISQCWWYFSASVVELSPAMLVLAIAGLALWSVQLTLGAVILLAICYGVYFQIRDNTY